MPATPARPRAAAPRFLAAHSSKKDFRLQLTSEQIEIIKACGGEVLPAAGPDAWRLSQQQRVFQRDGQSVVVRRGDGFLETRGTLSQMLQQHAEALRTARALLPPEPEPAGIAEVEPAAPRAEEQPSAPRPRPSPAADAIPQPPQPQAPPAVDAEPDADPAAGEEQEEPVGDDLTAVLPTAEMPVAANSVAALRDAAPTDAAPRPAVPVEDSVQPDHLVCLEDGKKLKMLKRYLRTNYDMSPEQYRARWSLPPDYPMVAPDAAERRSALAKQPRPGARVRVAASGD